MKIKNSCRYIAGVVLIAAGIASITAMAQDQSDALRYSFLSPQGTARSLGFGSALGSVGGDFATLSVNPAGIGIYRRSEAMVTPTLRFGNSEGQYLNGNMDDARTAFNFSNLGIVFTRAEKGRRYEKSKWKTVSFAVGINRMADFNRNYSYGGDMRTSAGVNNSFSELFVNDANQYPLDVDVNGTLGYLGWQSYLVNNDSMGFYSLASSAIGLRQLRSVSEKGGISEIVVSLGGNYQEKIMIGATLGLPSVRYTRDAFFQETDLSGNGNDDFGSFRYSESLRTTGLGVNLKLGVIYKPADAFRLGVAIHTPTWFALNDEFNESLTANTEGYQGVVTVQNDPRTFNYNLTTPWRGIISGTAMLGQYGFISADYEYVDYKSVRYRFSNEFRDEQTVRNSILKNTFQGASNIRIGIEGRMDNFFARGGFGYYGNPYQSSASKHNRMDFSLGLGLRNERAFIDLAFVHSRLEQTEIPYSIPASTFYPAGLVAPTAKLDHKMNTIALTLGIKM